MKNSKITFNALAAILQVIIIGVVYLILYRFILLELGIELLGIWSLVVASTSALTIANFGVSSSVVKFVSNYYAKNRIDLINKLIFTSSIFVFVTYFILSIIVYFVAQQLLGLVIEEKYLEIALKILPFSFISLLVNTLSGVITSSIDGVQKNYIKSIILIFSSFLLLILSFLLTPKYGIFGLVYAQIFQALFVFFISIILLRKIFKNQIHFGWFWDIYILKEILGYGLKIQASSLLQMTFDPLVKFFLSKFGGLASVGYYEMAYRLVIQLRGIIVNANQVIVPVIAENQIKKPQNIILIYKKSFSLILFLNIILITSVIVFVPYISMIWIGHYEKMFVYSVILISIAMFFNISSNPAYFSYLGEGKLNWIVITNAINFIIILLFGYLLGSYLGKYGVIIANSIAIITSALKIGRAHV